MNNAQLLQLVIATLPHPERITDIDFSTEASAIRFTWNGKRQRVSQSLSVDTVDGGLLIGDERAYLIGAILEKGAAKPTEPRQDAAAQPAFIDPLAEPEIILLDTDGQPMKQDAGRATAFYLPQYRRMFTAEVQTASSWDAAVAMGPTSSVLGETNWHLTYVKEQELLVSRKHNSPATYPILAPYTPTNDWYWTADPHPSASSLAFCVALGYGDVNWYYRGYSGLVRLCREVSPRQALAFGSAT